MRLILARGMNFANLLWMQSAPSLDEVRSQYGEWTAMSIHLGDGLYTLSPPRADGRLRRLLQISSDLSGKPIDQLRVLDLACLEGHYAIEFALQGATAVGIEYREPNLAKARFVKEHLQLNRLQLFQDDVRNLSREKYGQFDVVICSGILYHLDVPDMFHFVRRIYEVCTRLAIFDTRIALHPETTVEFENRKFYGLWFQEHDEWNDAAAKLKNLWASVDNDRSFWPTPESLANLMETVGFSSFYECLNPHHETTADRRCYVAIKAQSARILSSPETAALGFTPKAEAKRTAAWQSSQAATARWIKQAMPRPLYLGIKRAFRTVRPKRFM